MLTVHTRTTFYSENYALLILFTILKEKFCLVKDLNLDSNKLQLGQVYMYND